MSPGIQRWLKAAGDSACYALAIIESGHDSIQPGAAVDILMSACARGFVYYRPGDPRSFFVDDPASLMGMAAGGLWTVRKEYNLKYQPKPGEKVIKYYEWDKGNGAIQGHFVTDIFDPWGDSQTVKNGKLKSLRVFARA